MQMSIFVPLECIQYAKMQKKKCTFKLHHKMQIYVKRIKHSNRCI